MKKTMGNYLEKLSILYADFKKPAGVLKISVFSKTLYKQYIFVCRMTESERKRTRNHSGEE